MSLLAILLLGQAASPKAILERYSQYRKLHPAYSADWSLTNSGQMVAQGTIMLDGEKRLLFKAANASQSYSLSETEKGVFEISPSGENYEEYPAVPFVSIPPTKLGPGASYVPVPLIRTNVYVSNIKYSVEPSITVGGDKADVVSWTAIIELQPTKFTLAVDAQGRIRRLTRGPGGAPAGSGGAGKAHVMPQQFQHPGAGMVWTMNNYRPIAHATLSAFYTPLPRGYVPFSMPPLSGINIQVDEVFPSIAWKSSTSMIDLKSAAGGKPEVILITAPDCAPSQKALENLEKLKADVPGISFSAVSFARSASEAHGLPYDSTGKAAAAIGDTSTPLFVLVDGTGKIRDLWAGFDPDGLPEFAKAVSEAVKKLTIGAGG